MHFPFSESVGYQIRATQSALQRFLQLKIEPCGVSSGTEYFLSVLWNEHGLTQRERSRRVGTMELTTLTAILSLEKKGLVRRVRSKKYRRKQHVHLTAKGSRLRNNLLPLAKEVVATAVQSLTGPEAKRPLASLAEVQKDLHATISQLDEINARIIE